MEINDNWLKKYDVTRQWYDEQYEKQGGLCLLCETHPISAGDHCHICGLMRGLVCHHCNSALGFFKDNILALKNAILYLEEHEENDIHKAYKASYAWDEFDIQRYRKNKILSEYDKFLSTLNYIDPTKLGKK